LRRANLILACLAVTVWSVTAAASLSGEPNDGFGPYAAFRGMVEGFTIKGGDELTRLSPLFPMLAWLPYTAFSNVIVSLCIVNAVAMFLLVFAACALCDRYQSNGYVKALVAVNIPLLARFAKMTAFLPAAPAKIDAGFEVDKQRVPARPGSNVKHVIWIGRRTAAR